MIGKFSKVNSYKCNKYMITCIYLYYNNSIFDICFNVTYFYFIKHALSLNILLSYIKICFIFFSIFISSPLLIASIKGYTDIVQLLLLNHQCNINIKNQFDSTSILLATMNGHYDIVKILIEHKANINILDKDHHNTINYAIEKEDIEILALLIRANANVNNIDKYGNTPLFWATTKGNLTMIKMLLDANADVNLCNKYGEKPYDIAETEEIKSYLLLPC